MRLSSSFCGSFQPPSGSPPGGGEGGAGRKNTLRRGVGAHSRAFYPIGDGPSARWGGRAQLLRSVPTVLGGEQAGFLRIRGFPPAIATIRGLRRPTETAGEAKMLRRGVIPQEVLPQYRQNSHLTLMPHDLLALWFRTSPKCPYPPEIVRCSLTTKAGQMVHQSSSRFTRPGIGSYSLALWRYSTARMSR